MIFVALHHADDSVFVRCRPLGKIGGMLFFIKPILPFGSHSVRFDIGFIANEQAVFVTAFIPKCDVRIMAHAHGIDIVLLHQGNVAAHHFFGLNMSCIRIMFM